MYTSEYNFAWVPCGRTIALPSARAPAHFRACARERNQGEYCDGLRQHRHATRHRHRLRSRCYHRAARRRAERRGFLQGQERQRWRSASRPAAATTSMPACSRATWASTSRAIPTIVPQNMPGAGGLRVAQYSTPPRRRTGWLFGTFTRMAHIAPLLRSQPEIRHRQVHLARRHHRRGQRMHHLAHLAGKDLERFPREADTFGGTD